MYKVCLFTLLVLGCAGDGAPALCQTGVDAAPGLSLPNGSRPYTLDTFQGANQLLPMHSSAVQTNNHKGSNVTGGLLAGPFYKAKFTTELEGKQAKTVLHTAAPVFFVRLNPEADEGQSALAGWVVVHVLVDKDKDRRLLSTVKFTQLTGNAKRSDTQVDAAIEPMAEGWIKITPKEALAPGEYALEPVMKQENAYSLVVYVFRVDPASTENAADVIQKADANQK